jgi:hypothetical protein
MNEIYDGTLEFPAVWCGFDKPGNVPLPTEMERTLSYLGFRAN